MAHLPEDSIFCTGARCEDRGNCKLYTLNNQFNSSSTITVAEFSGPSGEIIKRCERFLEIEGEEWT